MTQLATILQLPVQVPILIGAADHLVYCRELRNKYQTNRTIKTWATYFLLKALTPSGLIKHWTAQRQRLLSFCKMTENCFRARLNEMKALQLVTITDTRSIRLVSYQRAAEILDIPYEGLIKINYNDMS